MTSPNHSLIPKLAFSVLDKAQEYLKDNNDLSEEIFEELHSLFGNTLLAAADLVDKAKITELRTEDASRSYFKIRTFRDSYIVYKDINFCGCQAFHCQVLENSFAVTCKHVLAVKLAVMLGKIETESVSDSHFIDMLNFHVDYMLEK